LLLLSPSLSQCNDVHILSTLETLARGNLRNADGNGVLILTQELNLAGSELGLATLAVGEVVKVEQWKGLVWVSPFEVASARLAEPTGSDTVRNFERWGDTESIWSSGEVELPGLYHLLLTRLHPWLANHAAWVGWVLLCEVGVIVTLDRVNVADLGGVDTDLLAILGGTVAGLVTAWAPGLCPVLVNTEEFSHFTFTVSAFIVNDVIWSPDFSVNDTWTFTDFTFLCLKNINIDAVAGQFRSLPGPDSLAACGGTVCPFLPFREITAVWFLFADHSVSHLALTILASVNLFSEVDRQWDCSVVTLTFVFLDTSSSSVPLVSVFTGA